LKSSLKHPTYSHFIKALATERLLERGAEERGGKGKKRKSEGSKMETHRREGW